MTRRLKLWIVSVLCIGALTASAVHAGLKPNAVPKTVPKVAVQTCQPDSGQLLGYINQERSNFGTPALIVDPALSRSAANKLADEVAGSYYGHNLLDGSNDVSFLRAQGVNAATSEDLNANQLTPLADWTTFKNSPSHYASLTNNQYIRVGIAESCTDYSIATETDPANNAPVGTHIVELTVVQLAGPEPTPVARSCASICNDGACSQSTGRGTCSYHGGVAY